MKAFTVFGPPMTGKERAFFASTPTGLKFEHDIYLRDVFEGMFFIPNWGVRGIRMTGGGLVALVPDGTSKLDELADSAKLLVGHLINNREGPIMLTKLSAPKSGAKHGSVGEYWHTSVNPKKHNGVEFWGPGSDRLVMDIEW